MNIILDSCALIHLLKNSDKAQNIIKIIDSQSYPFLVISIVTKAELLSLTLKNHWGEKKINELDKLFKQFLIIPIESNDILQRYAEIDAYSQGKLTQKPLPVGVTSRNMGKNDIWIASTASLTKAKLITHDNDFDHLDNIFVSLEKY